MYSTVRTPLLLRREHQWADKTSGRNDQWVDRPGAVHFASLDGCSWVQGTKEAYLLFPVYPEGTLQDHVLWLTEREPPLAHPERLTPFEVLHITRQVSARLPAQECPAPRSQHKLPA